MLEEVLEESPEETQSDESATDGKVKIGNGQKLTEPTESTDNATKNDMKKKPNLRK